MAERTEIAKQTIAQDGIAPSFEAASADGHYIEGSGNDYLEVKNTSASPVTVTVPTPIKVAGLEVEDLEVVVPATSGHKKIGPFMPRAFTRPPGGADPGVVYVDIDPVADVTVGLFGF